MPGAGKQGHFAKRVARRYLADPFTCVARFGHRRVEFAVHEDVEDAAFPGVFLDYGFAGSKFQKPRIRPDLLAAIAAAEQDDVHVKLVTKLAVGKLFDEFGYDVNIAKCLYYLLVLFYFTWHRGSGSIGI